MVTSGVVTAVFHRLRQPVVLGYILAGVIIGPHTPPFSLLALLGSADQVASAIRELQRLASQAKE